VFFLLVPYLTTRWLFIEREDDGNCAIYAAVNETYSKKLAESRKWHKQGIQNTVKGNQMYLRK
jgi:hypothetical protein